MWAMRLWRSASGAAACLVALLMLGSSAADAVSIPSGVYTLPVAAGDATTVDLGAAPGASDPGLAAFPQWLRLRPDSPADTLSDFSATVAGSFVSGGGTTSNPWLYDITFEVAWNGTIDELPPSQPFADTMFFAIVDSRFGTGMTFATTNDLPLSGFVRGSFAVDGNAVTPEILQDDTGAMSGSPSGFVSDVAGNRWIGFALPADQNVHTITARWALGQNPGSAGDVFFPNAMFLPVAVPEPGAAALLGAALLLGLGRRLRAR